MKQSKVIALCGMMAALSVVIMLVGGVLGIGTYVSPMLAGIFLIPIGHKYGKKYHLGLWGVVSILSFVLVPNVEQNLMFLFLFGLYPIIYPYFQKLPKVLRIITKLLYFNIVTVALEALVMMFLVPETMGTIMTVILLLLGNFTFIMYDFLIPRSEFILNKYLGRFMKLF